MKPHALRKMLWVGNVGLVGVVALAGASLGLGVVPATAEVFAQDSSQIAPEHQALIDAIELAKRQTHHDGWKLPSPVTAEEIRAVLLDKWSRPRRERAHFPFVGPLPPPLRGSEPEGPDGVVEQGLAQIARPVGLIYVLPRQHVVAFEFESGESRSFRLGAWIRSEDGGARRFKLLGVEEVSAELQSYTIHFAVWRDGLEERRGTLAYENAPDLDGLPALISDFVQGLATSRVRRKAGTAPTDAAPTSLKDAKPLLRTFTPTRKAIVFSERTRAFFRGKHVAALAASIKTEIATRGGRVVGLRITGLGITGSGRDMPGDVFDVRRGDVLVSINGTSIRDRTAVVALLGKLSGTELVTVVVLRRGREITYRVDPRDPKNRRRVRYFENIASSMST